MVMPSGCSRGEHSWPAELSAHAACEHCGLPYAEWTEEDE